MLIESQNGEVITTIENGPILVRGYGDHVDLQQDAVTDTFTLGRFSDIDRAKEIMGLMMAAYDRGNSSYKVPPDEFIEEVCRVYVDNGNFLDVTRTGRVIRVAVQDELNHGCYCQSEGCIHIGGCISSLSQLSVKNWREDGTD